MKRILICKKHVDLSEDYAKNLFSKRRNNFTRPLDRLNDLERELQILNKVDYADYVRKIIEKYSIINVIRPENFDDFHNAHFNFPSIVLNDNSLGGRQKFHELIVKAMRYADARTDFLPYVQKLGIKTCVYCNAQLAVTVKKNGSIFKGMYDLDHFYPKSKYPYLCTSFFNLQPVCACCNRSKSDNKAKFSLYTINHKEISPFNFQLDKKSLIKYNLNNNCEELKIIFDSSDIGLKDDHEKHFHISKLYETQKDLAEEIIWKTRIYNESYQTILRKISDKLPFKHSDLNRLIIGNYDRIEDIHKRPMSKFVQDIAQQLKLI